MVGLLESDWRALELNLWAGYHTLYTTLTVVLLYTPYYSKKIIMSLDSQPIPQSSLHPLVMGHISQVKLS